MKRALLIVALVLQATFARAQTDIFVKGANRQVPIAIPQLCLQAGESTAPRDISRLIARDLDLSGYFRVLNPEAYIETPGKCGGPGNIAYTDWSAIGAEGVVRGVIDASSGKLRVQMYLHDVQGQKVVLGKEYEGDLSQGSRVAHKFANEIMKYFTGEYGVFGTQIAYSSKVGRFKEIFMMDMDGSNVRQLTDDKGLAVSANWDPTGRFIAYTSYKRRQPDLFVLDTSSRRVTQITNNSALELSPHFSHDGTKILASQSIDGDSDIVIFSRQGQLLGNLTKGNRSIDVSGRWSPDESKIVFCSNRAGGPQIYVMNSDGSGAHRISFTSSNYCTSPAWSPKGDKIAFVCRADAGFQLFVENADGSAPLQLTAAGDNEDPDWSPDGRYLVFASTAGRGGNFHLNIMRADGENMKQISDGRIGDTQPSWGPLLP